jgi:DNA-directed RNA polymerase
VPTIADQLELEENMQARGIERYVKGQRSAEADGRGATLDYSRRLISELVQPISQALLAKFEDKNKKHKNKAKTLLKRLSPEIATYIALTAIFNCFTRNETVVKLGARIGQQIEDEIRFSRFEAKHKDYYSKIKSDFKRKGTKDYRFMHRVLTHNANKLADEWNSWTQVERALVGTYMIDLVLVNADIIQKRMTYVNRLSQMTIVPSDEARDWIARHEGVAQFFWPDKLPCIIPPDDWVNHKQGGYYSPGMRQTTPMVKVSAREHNALLDKADLSLVMDALNKVQRIAWRVNDEVLAVVDEVWTKSLGTGMPATTRLVPSPSPVVGVAKADMTVKQAKAFKAWKQEAAEVYTMEQLRVSKLMNVSRVISTAKRFRQYGNFWFVWYTDFRGRMYTASAGFSPQGSDVAKGILQFSNAQSLGKHGARWLKIHGANRFGYDKVDFDGRVQWVNDSHDLILATARSPLEYRHFWGQADKPWQFLAFVFEYRDLHEWVAAGNSERTFKSRIRVGLDGSCNGLQNYSAMLRDERGGAATNLVPSDKPADIYSDVARVCYGKLEASRDVLAKEWIAFAKLHGKPGCLPRTLTKRPVMTLPYGSTRNSCTRYIFESIMELDGTKFFSVNAFQAAIWLTPMLWDSMGEVVVAAREGMKWLQRCATIATKAKRPLQWTTQDGFIVLQHAKTSESKRFETQLNGRFQMNIGTLTKKINGVKQRLGIAPNFIHSQDATHMRAVVRLAEYENIHEIDVIHDDFGTHAGNTETLYRLIREAFVTMYSSTNPLESFTKEQVHIACPPLPPMGTLDIKRILQSPYFFN